MADEKTTPKYALGKKPFEPSPKDFKLADVLKTSLPTVPAKKLQHGFGYGNLYSDWGMLGNDQYGDCVFAGADHEVMLWNKLAKKIDVPFTRDNTLADYGAVTGFDPDTGANDNGTNVRDALDYRRSTGLIDANGSRHLIQAYASIDPKDFDLLLQCIWTFGVVGIGFEVPNSIWKQFDAGKVWDVVSPDGGIDGGHYVPMVGSPGPDKVTFITWGQRTVMSRAFYEKYNDEAWVPLTQEELFTRADGSMDNVRHIDWDVLNSMLTSL
jgi:hypothetical protein